MRIGVALPLLGALALASLLGCNSHEEFCGLGEVACVESCGGDPFLQCGACPDGSVPTDECPDAGP